MTALPTAILVGDIVMLVLAFAVIVAVLIQMLVAMFRRPR